LKSPGLTWTLLFSFVWPSLFLAAFAVVFFGFVMNFITRTFHGIPGATSGNGHAGVFPFIAAMT
jgi:hypothetical protein